MNVQEIIEAFRSGLTWGGLGVLAAIAAACVGVWPLRLARGAYEDWAWKCNVLIGRRLACGTHAISLFNGAGRDHRDHRDIRDIRGGNFKILYSRRSWRSRRSRQVVQHGMFQRAEAVKEKRR